MNRKVCFMYKKDRKNFFRLIFISLFLLLFCGFKSVLDFYNNLITVFFWVISAINQICIIKGTSFFSQLFSHIISYHLVGKILLFISILFLECDIFYFKYIGKVLYFIIKKLISPILDFFSRICFRNV